MERNGSNQIGMFKFLSVKTDSVPVLLFAMTAAFLLDMAGIYLLNLLYNYCAPEFLESWGIHVGTIDYFPFLGFVVLIRLIVYIMR